ncbi:hypothetical protein MP228_005610 [Amoeboaphelidium protococcarum]|nr:hypothetical protein MP228_005610 [Amoeboaphelidium protococcarum]
MGADHAYVPPKTDGTFKLKVNWDRLAASKVQPAHNPDKLPHHIHAITQEEFNSKTLREWWNYKNWRQTSFFGSYSPKKHFENYVHKYYSAKVPDRRIFIHWFMAVGTLAFITHYGKNSGHTYAKHH